MSNNSVSANDVYISQVLEEEKEDLESAFKSIRGSEMNSSRIVESGGLQKMLSRQLSQREAIDLYTKTPLTQNECTNIVDAQLNKKLTNMRGMMSSMRQNKRSLSIRIQNRDKEQAPKVARTVTFVEKMIQAVEFQEQPANVQPNAFREEQAMQFLNEDPIHEINAIIRRDLIAMGYDKNRVDQALQAKNSEVLSIDKAVDLMNDLDQVLPQPQEIYVIKKGNQFIEVSPRYHQAVMPSSKSQAEQAPVPIQKQGLSDIPDPDISDHSSEFDAISVESRHNAMPKPHVSYVIATKSIVDGTDQKPKEEEQPQVSAEEANKKMCDSCYQELELTEFFSLDCKHEFCKECFLEHLTSKITDGQVSQIPCMTYGCNRVFQDKDIERFASDELNEKYKKFKENFNVDVDPNLLWCPKPGCGNVLKKADAKSDILSCSCGAEVCVKCCELKHEGVSCENAVDPEYKKWEDTQANIQNCPICGVRTDKMAGCNKITCTKCKNTWCWLCREPKIGYDHFRHKPGSSPFNDYFIGREGKSCAGNLMQTRDTFVNDSYILMVLVLILLPLIILLKPIITPLISAGRAGVVVFVVWLIIGVPVTVFFWSLAYAFYIICWWPMMAIELIKRIRRKYIKDQMKK